MALNLQQVFDKIREIGLGVRARQQDLDERREQARKLLATWAGQGAGLRDKVELAQREDPNLRCALPVEERLDLAVDEPESPDPVTLLAADGSQIAPDRHASLLFSLVNVGAILLEPGSGSAPQIFTDSELFFGDELYTETGLRSAEAVDQQRDIAERKKLLELAGLAHGTLIAMTDGPVELWGAKDAGEGDYRKNLELHKTVLSQLQARGVTVAGYVDKPGADLLVRSLEIADTPETELKDIRLRHPLRGVTDRWLFGFLGSGQRSAVFGLQSSSRVHYTGDLSLHFFYLNVGDKLHPALARVEFPRWVAQDGEKLALLQSALMQQCRVMGARPYPYILHRAHEIAVVSLEDKQQVELMLNLTLRQAGGEVEVPSNKQSAKDLPGRTGRK